jgi:hypothetical protein
MDDIESEIHRVIGECAGAVSMCWEPRPEGVFDSTQAVTYVEGAVARVLSVMNAEADRRVDRMILRNAQQQVRLRKALEFYADPATYHAIAFLPDPPCGDFVGDFSEDHGDSFYPRAMPGMKAREVLRGVEPDDQ